MGKVYIDKAAVVAEINRVLNSYDPNEITSGRYALASLRDFINTLVVKEVDLEHEVESYWKQCDMTWCRDAYSMTHIRSMLSDIAKHFFELGIKARKGE